MDTEEAIKGIQEHRKTIHLQKQWNDPLQLSDTMTKLAVYNAYLADNIAQAHYEASETHLAAFKASRELENGVGESEALAKWESLEKRRDYENVKYIYTATGNLITVLQTRLKAIENQLKREEQSEQT